MTAARCRFFARSGNQAINVRPVHAVRYSGAHGLAFSDPACRGLDADGLVLTQGFQGDVGRDDQVLRIADSQCFVLDPLCQIGGIVFQQGLIDGAGITMPWLDLAQRQNCRQRWA
jgi:hypothetical protein